MKAQNQSGLTWHIAKIFFRLGLLVSKFRRSDPSVAVVMRWWGQDAITLSCAAESADMELDEFVNAAVMTAVVQVAAARAEQIAQTYVPPRDGGALN